MPEPEILPEILVDSAGPVWTVTLNRPAKLNAWTGTMMEALLDVLARAAVDPDARAIVLTGAGKAFCIGPDHALLAELGGLPDGALRAGHRSPRRLIDAVRALEKPVIAAINGTCVSGGLELAMAADLRIAAAGARLGYPDAKLGLVPAIGGTAQLARLVRADRAKLMIFGAELIDGTTAAAWGLATEAVPDEQVLARAQECARLFASRAPLAVGLAKFVLNRAEDHAMDLTAAAESLAAALARRTDDHREGMAAFREKRPPRFEGR